ncbi:MAG: redoxin family protein [Clostridia bacterium]|nr:redoxin family protein [Clostridia bacterium]
MRKSIKKLLLLCTSLVMCASFAFATACNDDESSSAPSNTATDTESETADDTGSDYTGDTGSSDSSDDSSDDGEDVNYIYRIKVQNPTGYGMRGITVSLYDGETKLASKTTSAAGYAVFKEADISVAGEYAVELENIPVGYVLGDKTYVTENETGAQLQIPLTPTGVIASTAPSGTSYKLGDVMYDFEVKTSDGSTFKLSEALKEKKMVMLNFWATWCGPCKSEFPAMNNAYYSYQNDVSILAMSTTDDDTAVANYKKTSGLLFDMCRSQASLTTMFNTAAIPTTVMIDRYGVIVFYEAGSMTSVNDFTEKFAALVEDDYQSKIWGTDEDTALPDDDTPAYTLPNVDAPKLSDVETALGATDFTASWNEQDEYSWPWLISDDGSHIYSSNPIDSSYSELYLDFTVSEASAVTFEYYISSEEDYDNLYVLIDGTIIHSISGVKEGWNTCLAYVFDEDWQIRDENEALVEHRLALLFLRDEEGAAGENVAKVRNLRIVPANELGANVGSTVFKYAATQLGDESSPTQYTSYVNAVYSEADGYYHVDTENGPILFANMMYASLWNETSVWQLAYNGYCVDEDGNDLTAPLEQHAWVSVNNMTNNGYTPVTEELKLLLEAVTRYTVLGQKWEGDWHENEWLELCVYYQPYGNATQMADPTKGISFHAAIEMNPLEEKNGVLSSSTTVSVPFSINPRGFKYKFTPTTAGVYNIYSTGSYDTECFLVASDQTTFLGTYTDVIGATTSGTDESGNPVLVADMNFNFHYYFEANTTYYMLFTTFLDTVADYEVVIKYVGETYDYLTNAATGPYSANLSTMEMYLPDAIDYALGNDGYYHYKNEDGTLGSIIYVDCLKATAFFPNNSLKDICDQATKYDVDKRAFYIDGVDYTGKVQQLCFKSQQNSGELKGFMPVDEATYELLRTITTSDKYEGLYNSWLMLCYYYKTLGPSA